MKKKNTMINCRPRNYLMVVLLMFAFTLIVACSTLMEMQEMKTAMTIEQQTAYYSAFKVKLLNTRDNIASACNTNIIISPLGCSKAKRFYNITADIYIITGEVLKASIDTENSEMYLNKAKIDVGIILAKEGLDSEVTGVLFSIIKLVEEAKNSYDLQTSNKLLTIIEKDILARIAIIIIQDQGE